MAINKNMEGVISDLMGSKIQTLVKTPGKRSQPVNVRKAGRPKVKPDPATSAESGCKIGEMRLTTILDKDLVEKLRRLAHWDRRAMKTIVSLALEKYIADHESSHGPLQPIPERK
jgi:hypothetical protein